MSNYKKVEAIILTEREYLKLSQYSIQTKLNMQKLLNAIKFILTGSDVTERNKFRQAASFSLKF